MTASKKTPTPAAPDTKVEGSAPETSKLQKAYVAAVHGDMLHLFTNVWFTKDPKKVEIDQFVQAQLDAGKLVIADE